MHRLLARQIRKHLGDSVSPEWEAFIEAIEATYVQYDEDRALLQRSMDLSSDELLEANSALEGRAHEHARAVDTLQKTVEAMGFGLGAQTPGEGPHTESLLGIADVLAQQVQLRNEMERQLSARETRLRMLMQSASDAILVIDGHTGMVLDANEAATRLFGYPLNELLTMHHTALHPLAYRQAYEDDRRLIVAERQAYSQGEAWALHSDGREIPIDVTSTVKEVDGVVLVQGILRDATQRRRHEATLMEARDAAEAASRLKSSLLANMSHELRTPLTAIIGFAEVVTEALEDRGGDELTEYTQLISQGGERLLTTLNSVLEFARLEAGREPLRPEPFDLHTRLASIVSFFSQQASQKGLALRFTSSVPAPCHVVLDPHGLERAIINLVSNAIKFTQQGEVHLGLDTEGDRDVVTVADTGIGISPRFMERVFEEFEQESVGVSRRHEGSGLGLAITKRLIEMMGGAIKVESELGKGTRFMLDLPRRVAAPPSSSFFGDLQPVALVEPPRTETPASPEALAASSPVETRLPAASPGASLDALPLRVLLADAEPTTPALLRHLLPASAALVTTHPTALATMLDKAALDAAALDAATPDAATPDAALRATAPEAWPNVIVVAAANVERCQQAARHVNALADTHDLARPHLVWITTDAVPNAPAEVDAVLVRPFTRGMVDVAFAGALAV
ncbi:MAG: HAMP domain-containing sensor histidine kinase [Bacteroidota bacterium]